MGVAGAGSIANTVNAAIGNRARFTEMRQFFSGVGEGFAAGVWREAPKDRPEFRPKRRKVVVPTIREDGAC
jgi:chlorophyllide a reductase subunit Y